MLEEKSLGACPNCFFDKATTFDKAGQRKLAFGGSLMINRTREKQHRIRIEEQRLHLCLPTLMCFAVLFLATPSFSQQTYRWTDDKGTVHFTDDPSKVPDRYREQVISIESPQPAPPKTPPPPKTAPSVKPKESPDRVKQYLEDYDRKAEEIKKLEKRATALEEELKNCEARLKEIAELEGQDLTTRTPYRPQPGGFVTPYSDEKVKLESRIQEIKPELESLQEKISSIRRTL
jgi:chaperonin cofactor prefoldin